MGFQFGKPAAKPLDLSKYWDERTLTARSVTGELEWDARNGVIVRLGQAHGIDTPVNALCSTLLSAVAWKP